MIFIIIGFGVELLAEGKPCRDTLLVEKENRFLNDTFFFFTGSNPSKTNKQK